MGARTERRSIRLSRRGCSAKNRTISAEASGPAGSVYEPPATPPDQACPDPCTVHRSATTTPSRRTTVRVAGRPGPRSTTVSPCTGPPRELLDDARGVVGRDGRVGVAVEGDHRHRAVQRRHGRRAAHRGGRRAGVVGTAVRQPGVHADRGEHVRVRGAQHGGHRRARREARDVHAVAVDRVGGGDLVDDPGEDRRLAGAAPLVAGPEPVPVPHRVGRGHLFGAGDEEPVLLGELLGSAWPSRCPPRSACRRAACTTSGRGPVPEAGTWRRYGRAPAAPRWTRARRLAASGGRPAGRWRPGRRQAGDALLAEQARDGDGACRPSRPGAAESGVRADGSRVRAPRATGRVLAQQAAQAAVRAARHPRRLVRIGTAVVGARRGGTASSTTISPGTTSGPAREPDTVRRISSVASASRPARVRRRRLDHGGHPVAVHAAHLPSTSPSAGMVPRPDARPPYCVTCTSRSRLAPRARRQTRATSGSGARGAGAAWLRRPPGGHVSGTHGETRGSGDGGRVDGAGPRAGAAAVADARTRRHPPTAPSARRRTRRHPPTASERRLSTRPGPSPAARSPPRWSPCARPRPPPASRSTSPAPRARATPARSSSASSTTTCSPACAASTPRCSPSSAARPARASRRW